MSAEDAKLIRDPVHGDIRIRLEDLELLDAPEMQRLRGVRQLGTAFHVFPSAHHTRFEHMLGTYHVAADLIRRVRANHRRDPRTSRDITSREESVIRAVALLHDITHIPHGHAMEDQDGLFPRHDRRDLLAQAVTGGRVGAVLRRRRLAAEVARHLSERSAGDSRAPYLSLLVNGHVGADILDYLRRDSYFTGLKITYDDRLLDFIKVDPASGTVYVDLVKHAMDREDILTEVLNLLHCRYVCSERIYYHHAKVASGALLSRAVELAVMGGLTRSDVAATTDAGLLTLLRERSYDTHPLGDGAAVRSTVRRLVERFEQRRLLKRCFVAARRGNEERQDALVAAFVGSQSRRTAFQAEIARAIGGVDPAEVIVYCPKRDMQLKEAAVPVRRAGRPIRPLTRYVDDFPTLRQLVDAYRDLWKLYVFVPLEDPDRLVWAGKRVERILAREFPGIKNRYRP